MDQWNRGRRWLFGVLLVALSNSMIAHSEVVGIFFDQTLPQSSFAASEIQEALADRNCTVELRSLSSLSEVYPHPKIILARVGDDAVKKALLAQGGQIPDGLGEQAYALRTTTNEMLCYWALGGDANGLMYGGLQLAENIRFNGLAGTYHSQEEPYINRGVKYNLPLDLRLPTYHGSKFKTDAHLHDAWRCSGGSGEER
ncbi:hypothetical protein P4E94_14610 [Pontiellaceae bacterium B12219]|nr:hypothetical protein [Pontiellaceae bacterium B12219]